jgi:hypothetical protein
MAQEEHQELASSESSPWILGHGTQTAMSGSLVLCLRNFLDFP